MNSLVVLAVIVSLATLVMLAINLYMMMQVKRERIKNLVLKQNVAALSVAIHKELESHETTLTLASSQGQGLESFLKNIERDLDQINRAD